MRFTTTRVVILSAIALAASRAAPAQSGGGPLVDSVRVVARIDSTARAIGRRYGTAIWPGFRPDTIPTVYVLPGRGQLLLGWRGSPPGAFRIHPDAAGALWLDDDAPTAASTAVALEERATAQVVLRDMDPAEAVATSVHEAFHVFAGHERRPGRRFGTGENSFFVASYPIFDVENEALFALEGKFLAEALGARSDRRRALARRAMAVRRTRHARLASELAGFDDASEMNEGLAQYAYFETLRYLEAEGPGAWRGMAHRHRGDLLERLPVLTEDVRNSFRLRYYFTGPAIAQLLDRLDRGWKARLLARNWTLETALAVASGLDAPWQVELAQLERNGVVRAESTSADARVARLAALRRAQADSILRRPGLLLVLRADSLPSRDFSSCGIDPQNLLQVTSRVRLHTRWWRVCGGGTNGDINVPSVHDSDAGTVSAVIGTEAQIAVTSEGKPVAITNGASNLGIRLVELTAPRVTLRAERADVIRVADTLVVRPRP